MISHFHEAVFIHIPKNAGQSIELTFLTDLGLSWNQRAPLLLRPRVDCDNDSPPRLAHLTGSQYTELKYMTPEMFDSYYKFCVCRNPWDRAFSLYKYLTTQSKPFKRFVIEDFEQEIYREKQWFAMSQSKFILDKNKNLLVDEIIRFENLDSDFKKIAAKVCLKKELTHANKSKNKGKKGYQEVYCKESKKIIADLYADDIELLGYKFD